MEAIRQLSSEAEFNSEVLESDMPAAVMFFADWCPHCRKFKPTFQQLANEYEGRVRFLQVDVDRSPDLEQKYAVEKIPTVKIFISSNVVETLENKQDADLYRPVLDQAANQAASRK